jgi:hypothetical protein
MAVCVLYILCIQPPTLQPLPTTMILLELGGVASPCLGGWGQPNCHLGVPPHILGSNWVLQPPGTRGTGGGARMVGCTWALAHTPHPHPTPQPPHLHHWLWGLPSWLQHTKCNPNPHPGLQGQVEWGLGGVATPWPVARRGPTPSPQPPTYTTGSGAWPPGCSILSVIPTPT